MGKQDIADEFSINVLKTTRMYYNPATSFMQPRDDKGTFIKDFKADDYTPHISAKATDGNTFGLYSMTLTD